MIKEVTVAVTQRSQVTIPVDALRALGVKPPGKVVFAIEGGAVRLAPVSFTLESAFGSVKPAERPTNFDALVRAAKDDKAGETMRELRAV